MTKVQKYDRKYSLKSKVNKSSNSKKKKTILILILLIIGISYAAYDYSFVVKERNVYRFQSGWL